MWSAPCVFERGYIGLRMIRREQLCHAKCLSQLFLAEFVLNSQSVLSVLFFSLCSSYSPWFRGSNHHCCCCCCCTSHRIWFWLHQHWWDIRLTYKAHCVCITLKVMLPFVKRHLRTVFFNEWAHTKLISCHLTSCHSLFLAACLHWLQDLGGWELETPRLVGLVLGGLV